jgi:twitching motility protein PilT
MGLWVVKKKNKASDLHLRAGLPPMIRVHGGDVRRTTVPAYRRRCMVWCSDIANDGQTQAILKKNLEWIFLFRDPELARFRASTLSESKQRGAGAAMRTIPSKVLSLEELNAPKKLVRSLNQLRGLVVG